MEFKEAEEVMEKYELKEVAEKDFNIATYGSTGKMQLALKFKIYSQYARKKARELVEEREKIENLKEEREKNKGLKEEIEDLKEKIKLLTGAIDELFETEKYFIEEAKFDERWQ